MNEWQKDLSKSANIFVGQIAPLFLKAYGGKLLHMETIKDSNFAKKFDQLSGIDAWHIYKSNIRGIASRVQWGNPDNDKYPYETFTIRYLRDSGTRTEFAKRKQAINSSGGWIYPHLTIQAYTDNDYNLLSFAVAPTATIINVINADNFSNYNRTGNAIFAIVDWSKDICEVIFKNDKFIHLLPKPLRI